MILFVLSLLFVDNNTITYRPEGIYEPIRRGDVVLADDGRLFVLDHRNVGINIFAPDGRLQKRFGTQGDGPGELDFPVTLYLGEDVLYVEDMARNALHEFDLDGTYRDQIRIPIRGLELAKVQNGWIGANSRMRRPDEKVALLWLDERMQEQQEIASFTVETPANMMPRRGSDEGPPTFPYNPVRDHTALAGAGRFAYFYRPGQGFRIEVVDAQQKKIVRTLSRDPQKIPFNQAFGDQQYDDFVDQNGQMNVRMNFEKAFPEFFPPVRELFVSGDDALVVRTWTGKPNETERLITLGADDSDRTSPFSDQVALRVLFVRNGFAYLNCFDEEEEIAEIVRAPMRKIAEIAAEKPFNYVVRPRILVRRR